MIQKTPSYCRVVEAAEEKTIVHYLVEVVSVISNSHQATRGSRVKVNVTPLVKKALLVTLIITKILFKVEGDP